MTYGPFSSESKHPGDGDALPLAKADDVVGDTRGIVTGGTRSFVELPRLRWLVSLVQTSVIASSSVLYISLLKSPNHGSARWSMLTFNVFLEFNFVNSSCRKLTR